MSIAFALSPPDSLERRVALALGRVVAGAGFGLSALQCASGPTLLTPAAPDSLRLSLAGLMAALALMFSWDGFSWLRGARRSDLHSIRELGDPVTSGKWPLLRVDEHGSARWCAPGGLPEHPVVLSRSLRLPGLIVLVLTPSESGGLRMRRVRLLLGRSGLGSEAWRSLNAWLTWTERGVRSTEPSPEPSRADSPSP